MRQGVYPHALAMNTRENVTWDRFQGFYFPAGQIEMASDVPLDGILNYPLIITDYDGAAQALGEETDIRHVISIGDVDDMPPASFGAHPARKLRLSFTDIERESPSCPWYQPCQWADVEAIIAFAPGVDGLLLCHCAAGISRSTAAALIVLASAFGPGREAEAVMYLCEVRPQAFPNRRMVWMADTLLGREGALIAAHRERWVMRDLLEVPGR